MALGTYILGGVDGHTPIYCADKIKWAEWYGRADRIVAFTKQGDVEVSTVFIGLDHGFTFLRNGPPVLFETLTFRGFTTVEVGGGETRTVRAASDRDRECCRYSTWDDALTGHRAICRRVFGKAYAEVMNDEGGAEDDQ